MIGTRISFLYVLLLIIILSAIRFGLLKFYMKSHSVLPNIMSSNQNQNQDLVLVFENRNRTIQPVFGSYYSKCPSDIKEEESKTFPRHYPANGTGISVANDGIFPLVFMETMCQTSPPLRAILPVYSAVYNFENRIAVRNTMGKECQVFNCKIVFICGISTDQSIMQKLQTEYVTFKDIVIVYKMDTYEDLNNKGVEMLNWLLNYCEQPKYVIHFIDDSYINIEMFYKDLEKSGDSIYGFLGKGFKPIRTLSRRDYVSPEIYPYPIYPDFILGAAYAFPNSLTLRLRCAVTKAAYHWLEDVWLTGHVRDTAHIKTAATNRPSIRYGTIPINQSPNYLYLHTVDIPQIYKIYDLVQHKRALEILNNQRNWTILS